MSDPLSTSWNRTLREDSAAPAKQQDDAALADFIDFGQMSEVFQSFLEVVGLPVAIIDLAGHVLASSNWQRLCMEFHRVNKESLARCVESDISLSRQMEEGKPYAIYRCRNGLTDCASPIVVEGRHVANLFTGQFLLAPPEMDYFRAQQESFGFEPEGYFQALAELPIVDEARLPAILDLLTGLARLVARQSLAERRALVAFNQVERQVVERTKELKESDALLRTLFDALPDVVVTKDIFGRFVMCNPAAVASLGHGSEEEMIGKTVFDLFPDEFARQYHADDLHVLAGNILLNREELRPHPSGAPLWYLTIKVPLRDQAGNIAGLVGISRDITERKRAEEQLRESEQMYRSLFDNMLNGFAYCRMEYENDEPSDFVYLSVNTAFERLTGLKDVVGKRVTEVISGIRQADPGLFEIYGRVARSRTPERFEIHLAAMDMWFSVSVYSPRQDHFVSIFDVITERKRAEAALRSSEANLIRAQAVAQIGSWSIDLQSNTLTWSAETYRIFGCSPDLPLTYEHFINLVHPDDRAIVDESWSAALAGATYDVEHRIIVHDQVKWVRERAELQFDSKGRAFSAIGTVQDITKLKHYQTQLKHLAHHDSLTGLPNRLLAGLRIEHAITKAGRSGNHLAVLFLDLDGFKHVNDTLGHHAGDLLLCQVAKRLSRTIRKEDTLARMGGDELIVLMESLPHEEDAALLAAKLNGALRAPFFIEERELFVTASIGIALYPRDGDQADTLLSNADAALYRAKSQGRDCFCFYTPELTKRVADRLDLEAQLRRAVERGEMVLHYQPQIDLHTGLPVGAEALVRWIHPDKGIISPASFIPLAEETGLIVPLGEWILREACRQMREWRNQGVPMERMAVNLAGPQILRGNMPETVQRVLREVGLEPRHLQLEVTETFIMDEAEGGAEALHALRELGVSLAIDDFGTGHSSLARLKRLPIHELKIDRSFVQGLAGDANDLAITRAIIALANSMELETLAEGVETVAQQERLVEIGCHRAQGFLYCRPIPAERVVEWIKGFDARRQAISS